MGYQNRRNAGKSNGRFIPKRPEIYGHLELTAEQRQQILAKQNEISKFAYDPTVVAQLYDYLTKWFKSYVKERTVTKYIYQPLVKEIVKKDRSSDETEALITKLNQAHYLVEGFYYTPQSHR